MEKTKRITLQIAFISFVLLLLSLPNMLFSQENAKVVGRVTNENNQPLQYVTVGLLLNNISTTTDQKGKYTLTVTAKKEYKLIFQCMGYQNQTFNITLKPSEVKEINVILKDTTTILNTIDITDTHLRNSNFSRLDPKHSSEIPNPSGDGIETMIKTLPGVHSNNELSSQYSVRGGNFDENLVYVNDIEIYRPFLVRSGEQEGLSFINADLVSSILFSAGGFDAKYGDKMSSALDIQYKKPTVFAGSAAMSLMGGSIHLEGSADNSKFTYLVGARQKSNQYVLNSLQTQGDYRPSFTDVQTLLTYNFNKKTELSFLGNYARNVYQVVPTDRETDFGTVNNALRLKIYFDGQEVDKFETFFGALSLTYRPTTKIKIKNIVSAFQTFEDETYDIQGEYWLYQLGTDMGSDQFGNPTFNRGIGTYINHARNSLHANVFNFENRGTIVERNHNFQWGIKYQREEIIYNLNEWKMVDSSGYTIPTYPDSINSQNPPHYFPELQNVYKADYTLSSNRITGFIQDEWAIDGQDSSRFKLIYGARFNYWDLNKEFLVSPRLTFSFKPRWKRDILFRLSSGVYYQSPFFKEMIDLAGKFHYDVKAQRSIHFVASADMNIKLWSRPFKFVTEAYYKYLDNLIPYVVDNVRIRYYASNNATGYATGLDFRLNGEFVKGIESWASLSLMQTKQKITYDTNVTVTVTPYIPRPTDQFLTFSMFFQDYLPKHPNIKMHLNLVFGTSLPFGPPNSLPDKQVLRMPSYRRVDIGSSFLLKDKNKLYSAKNIFRRVGDIWFSIEVFNLLDVSNTISYTWVTDIDNRQYAVPNYLTPRMLNAKLLVEF